MKHRVGSILEQKGATVHSTTPDTTVFDAITKMVDRNVGALLVMENDQIVGIITERDYLRQVALQGRSSRNTPVREIMTTKLIYVEANEDVDTAMAIMTKARIRHLPVMEEGRLAGIVSQGDLVRELSHAREVEIQYLTDYIRGKYPG
jgi:CBS domain-containing protein